MSTQTAPQPVMGRLQPKDQRTIETGLINKEEVFRMLALAEATGLPILLVGDPGVAKTKTVLDYAKAWIKDNTGAGENINTSFMNKIFILETDEGTKSTEVKGMPDLEVLFQENKYQLDTPIAEADIVVVNEIDKASSGIRNSLLGVMNERMLFNGKHKKPCKWKIFIGTCNEIPKEEIGSPFWDRFMLKMKVDRVTQGEMSMYYAKGARNYKESISLGVPTRDEIASINIPNDKLEKFLDQGYKKLSDRTLTFVPFLTQSVAQIWNYSVNQSLVKACQILIDSTTASDLKDKLISKEMKEILSRVELIATAKTKTQINNMIVEIEKNLNGYAQQGAITREEVDELSQTIKVQIAKHPTSSATNNLANLDL